jgi:dynein heavy chain
LETWVRVQANFLYLAPVMQSEDIRTTLPQEAKEFSEVSEIWREIMARLQARPEVLEITNGNNLLEQLTHADTCLEQIVKKLSIYLETKRECFPRFYFLSNEELLEILGESRNPERVQPHLKKCFEGVQKADF